MENLKISPIFYMGNKKKLINKGLINLFPKNIDTFYDLFAGSGIVSMNVKANEYILNDIEIKIYKFYRMFQEHTSGKIISSILNNINTYKMKRVGVKQNTEESALYKQRYFNMRKYANNTQNILDLYSCMFYAFSQQMRFNKKGDFNMPFGNGAFTKQNEEYIKNGCEFFKNIRIMNKDFKEFDFNNLIVNDFVYFDPPYLDTTATYNENGGWKIEDENDLHKICEELNSKGLKWGMSNIFECKGKINQQLINWCDKNNWNVYTFDKFTYSACGKGNSQAKEVYICNY